MWQNRRRQSKSARNLGRWPARSASLWGTLVRARTRLALLSHSLIVEASSSSSMTATLLELVLCCTIGYSCFSHSHCVRSIKSGQKRTNHTYFRNSFKIDHLLKVDSGHYCLGMKVKLSLKEILAVHCPICGAAPGEKCELSSGQPRTDSHRDRELIERP